MVELGEGCLGLPVAMPVFGPCAHAGPPSHAAGLAEVLGKVEWAAIPQAAPGFGKRELRPWCRGAWALAGLWPGGPGGLEESWVALEGL